MVATYVPQMFRAHVPTPEHPWWQVIIWLIISILTDIIKIVCLVNQWCDNTDI